MKGQTSSARLSRTAALGLGQLLNAVPSDSTSLPDNIGLHLRLVQLRLFREFQRAFQGTGLTPSMHAMLCVIRENPGIRQGALADTLLVCAPNAAAAVAGLHEAGLIERTVDQQDRRALCVRLTPRGEQLLDEAQALVDSVESKLLDGFSDQEHRQLRRYLKRLLESIG